jgi:hypothetical protein
VDQINPSWPPPLQHSASGHRRSPAGARRPLIPETRGRHITTRTGGTLDSRPRREPHQGSSLQGHKMTGSGADHVSNKRVMETALNAGASERRHCSIRCRFAPESGHR